MWIKVLPADMAKEPYWEDIPDVGESGENELETYKALRQIIAGDVEVIKTQTLVDKFGYSEHGQPNVVMVINEMSTMYKLPPNKRASIYYPNDYDLPIRGEAVLVGWQTFFDPREGPWFTFGPMPKKWKIIYDMETIVVENRNDYEKVHSLLDDLLLEVADEDVAKMYKEAREQFEHWPTA
jgi:hypothetical protein